MDALKFILAASILFDIVVLLWVLVLSRAKQRIAKAYAIVFTLSIFWKIGIWCEFYLYLSPYLGLWNDRLTFSIGALTFIMTFYFFWELVGRRYIAPTLVYAYTGLMGCIVLLALCSDALIIGREYIGSASYSYYILYGPLFLPYYVSFFPIFIALIYLFVLGHKKMEGIHKIRLQIVGCGVLIAAIPPLFFAVLQPLLGYFLTGTVQIGGEKWLIVSETVAAIGTTLFSLISGYAITRYRFLDIKVFLKKTIVYGVTIVLFSAAYIGALYAFYRYFQTSVVFIVGCFVAVLIADQVKKWLKYQLDNVFFLDELKLYKNISDHAAQMNTTKELEEYVDQLIDSIQKQLPVQVLSLHIREREHHRYACYFPKQSQRHFSFDDPLVSTFLRAEPIIVAKDIGWKQGQDTKRIVEYLESKKADALMLIRSKQEVDCIIVLGTQEEDWYFEYQDIAFLETIIEKTKFHLAQLIHFHELLEGNKIILHEKMYE